MNLPISNTTSHVSHRLSDLLRHFTCPISILSFFIVSCSFECGRCPSIIKLGSTVLRADALDLVFNAEEMDKTFADGNSSSGYSFAGF
jgi:hypothetical protein